MATADIELIHPDWPAPAHVRAASTTRFGGFSAGPYASLNLGAHVGDDSQCVARNRNAMRQALNSEFAPLWLDQVHGTRVVVADRIAASAADPVAADASITSARRIACAILTADCLPVLFSDREGKQVAAAHAGWRGLVAGVLENTVAAFGNCGVAPETLIAWIGPAIGAVAYEVDGAVVGKLRDDDRATLTQTDLDHWQFDLAALARRRLMACGVAEVFGGDCCTFSDPERFFSYRRDGTCGRQATLIWRE